MPNEKSEMDSELNQQLNAMHRSAEPSADAEVDARVRLSLARIEHVCGGIDEREELLRQVLTNADAATKHAYVKAIADDAFEQWQDLCFILSTLQVASVGSRFHGEISSAVEKLGETLEHLSITGGADEAEASAQFDPMSQFEQARLTQAEVTRAEPALEAAKLNVVEKAEELHEAIEELEALGGGDPIVDAAMMGINALGDHLEGNLAAQMSLDILAENLASR